MTRQLLVFPVAVVLLAFLAFAFGGHCASWQWWAAVGIAVVAGFWRRSARDGARGGLFFLGWMLVCWVGCGVIAGAAWTDEVAYHFPAVRMLAGGWNPLWNCSPETVLASAGLEPGDCWIDHIVFMPKIVWVFDAEAWFFTGDVFNPQAPILWFVFPAVVVRIWHSMRGVHVLWKLLAVPILYCIVPNAAHTVDAVVALSAIGLLLSFEEVLSGRGFDALSMVVYSFWMMGSKTPGLLHGGFFWTLFLGFVLWRRRSELKRLLGVIAPTALLLVIVNSTPYLTSIRDYGHPFYPKYSFDEKRFPVRDLTQDFLTGRNADAAQMGYCGLYVNAFISPALAQAWYRWRLDRPDFMPYSRNYKHYPNDADDGACPTRRRMRCLFWLSVAWLLFGARKSWRIPALSVLLCIGAAPAPLLGYMRYIPWWLSPALFAYIDFSGRDEKWVRRTMCALLLLFNCMIRPHTLYDRTVFAMSLVERRMVLADLFECRDTPVKIRPTKPDSMGHLKLMARHAPWKAVPEVLPFSSAHFKTASEERLQVAALLFMLDDLDEMRQRTFRWPADTKSGIAYAAHAGFATLPRAVANRIASLWRDRKRSEKEGGGA